MIGPLQIQPQAFEQVDRDCRERLPQEAVGYLLASECEPSNVVWAVPLENSAPDSQNSFFVRESESLRVLRWAAHRNLEIVGLYHSHPRGPLRLSQEDLQGRWSSHWLVMLWTPGAWRCWSSCGTSLLSSPQ